MDKIIRHLEESAKSCESLPLSAWFRCKAAYGWGHTSGLRGHATIQFKQWIKGHLQNCRNIVGCGNYSGGQLWEYYFLKPYKAI